MTRLGLILDNAETVEVQEKGEVTVLTVQARGATKRAAKRGARKEASSIIPVHEQNFINETELGDSSRFNKQWLFNISNNGDSHE